MTTIEELKARRGASEDYIAEGVAKMHQEARLYQLQTIRKELGLAQREQPTR